MSRPRIHLAFQVRDPAEAGVGRAVTVRRFAGGAQAPAP
jgi:hypothetical protein